MDTIFCFPPMNPPYNIFTMISLSLFYSSFPLILLIHLSVVTLHCTCFHLFTEIWSSVCLQHYLFFFPSCFEFRPDCYAFDLQTIIPSSLLLKNHLIYPSKSSTSIIIFYHVNIICKELSLSFQNNNLFINPLEKPVTISPIFIEFAAQKLRIPQWRF